VRLRNSLALSVVVLAFVGCAKEKPTGQMVTDLKSSAVRDRIAAVRLLQHRKGDAAQVVPALTEALKDKADDVRWSAAIGLGYFGEQAKEAIPALEEATHDSDARVREGAGVALSRIDPEHFKSPSQKKQSQ
jgi:HEAT repeat protein